MKKISLYLFLTALLCVSGASYGATYTWLPTGDAPWGNAANWTPNTGFPNAAGDVANVTSNITNNQTVDVGAQGGSTKTVGILNVGDPTGGSSFNFNNGTIIFNNSGAGAQLNQLSGAGSTNFNVGITLSDSLTINNNSANTINFNGGIAGGSGFALIKSGTGSASFNTGNSFSGGLTVNQGSIFVGGSNRLGTGVVTINSGGALQSQGNDIGTGPSGFVYNGGTYRGLANNSNYTTQGNVTVGSSGATFISDITGGNSFQRYEFGSLSIGTAQLLARTESQVGGKGGNGTIQFNGAITLTGNATFRIENYSGGNVTNLNLGALTDGGAARTITASGNGLLNLGSAATSIVNGTQFVVTQTSTLQTSNSTATGTLAAINVVDSTATLNLNAGSQVFGSLAGAGRVNNNSNSFTVGNAANNLSSTFSGSINGTGALTKSGTGTFTLSGSNSYTGATTVSGGVLKIGNASALGTTAGSTTVAAGATLDLNGQTVGAEGLTLSGSGVGGVGALVNTNSPAASLSGGITLNATSVIGGSGDLGAITLSGAIGGGFGLTKAGSQILTLSGGSANGYTGVTTILGGELILAKNVNTQAVGSVVVGNGVNAAALTQNATADQILNSGTITVNNNGTFNVGANEEIGSLIVNSGGTVAASSVKTLLLQSGGIALQLNNGASLSDSDVALSLGTFGSSVVITGSSATASVIAGAINLGAGGANHTFQVDDIVAGSANDATISGILSNSNPSLPLIKTGAGKLTLSGSNTYGGDTYVYDGALVAASNTALGSGTNSPVLLGNTSGANSASLLIGGAFAVNHRVTVQSGNSGVSTLGGDTADASTFSKDITMNKSASFVALAGGSSTFAGVIGGGNSATIGDAQHLGTVVFSNTANTYSGTTTIGSGATLEVKNLVGGGTNSSIGNSSNAATNLVINGGTLKYTGAGGSTDRLLTYNASGATIDASAAANAAFSFTNTAALVAAGTGNRSLTLTGSSTGLNTLSSRITDPSSGQTSLNKSGSGQWVLTGSNSFSGGTTVNAGTLLITGSNSAGTQGVNVASGTFRVNVASGAGAVSNSITMTGAAGRYVLERAAGTAYSAYASSDDIISGIDTSARLLAGTAGSVGGGARTLVTSFNIVPSVTATNDNIRVSDVFSLQGTKSGGAPGNGGDIFVLQLAIADITTGQALGWLNGSNTWVLANAGNSALGGSATQDFNGSYASFVSLGGGRGANSSYLGSWGTDATGNTVWAILDHNSEFAVIPEPSTIALIGMGFGVVLYGFRRRSVKS